MRLKGRWEDLLSKDGRAVKGEEDYPLVGILSIRYLSG